MLADLGDQAALVLEALLLAGLAEARRHHDERAHTLDQAVVEHVVDARGRHRDHREVDGVGDVADGLVGPDPPHRRRSFPGATTRRRRFAADTGPSRLGLLLDPGGAVDREHRPGESPGDDVGQQGVSDLVRVGRGPDHRDRGGSQQIGDAAGLRRAFTGVAHRQQRLGGVDEELDVHGRAVEAPCELIPRIAEHRDHVRILAEDLGLETGETVLRRRTGQVFEQDGSEAAALVFIGDDERNLGRFGFAVEAETLVDADRDDLAPEFGDDRDTLLVVDGRHPGHLARRQGRSRTEVPHVPGALGELGVEGHDAVGVVGHDRSQVHDAAIGGQHIGDPVPRIVPRATRFRLIGHRGSVCGRGGVGGRGVVSHGGPPGRDRGAGRPRVGWRGSRGRSGVGRWPRHPRVVPGRRRRPTAGSRRCPRRP